MSSTRIRTARVYTFNDGQDRNIIAIDGADPRAGQNKGQKGWGIGNNITFTDIGWITGDHTIKLGVKYKDVDLTAQDSVPGRPVFYLQRDGRGRRPPTRGRPYSRCRWRDSIPA